MVNVDSLIKYLFVISLGTAFLAAFLNLIYSKGAAIWLKIGLSSAMLCLVTTLYEIRVYSKLGLKAKAISTIVVLLIGCFGIPAYTLFRRKFAPVSRS